MPVNQTFPILLVMMLAVAVVVPAMSLEQASGAEQEASAADPQTNSALRPVPGGVRWFGRMHADNLRKTRDQKFNLCLLGDSITAMWPGDLFGRYFGEYQAVNFGIGGDRTENILWRLERGELRNASPQVIVLMIGTNNQSFNTAEEMAAGVTAVVEKLRATCPKSKILLLGLLPAKTTALEKTQAVNTIVARLDDGKFVRYLDAGAAFLDDQGRLRDGLLSDQVHLTRQGYELWGDQMAPLLAELVKDQGDP